MTLEAKQRGALPEPHLPERIGGGRQAHEMNSIMVALLTGSVSKQKKAS